MADFKPAVALTLIHEGGYVNDPRDAGGETMMGITAKDMPGQDMKSLTVEQATAYYQEHYWKPLYSEIQSQDVASKLFDMGVLFGVGEAAYLLQRALNFPTPKWTKTFDETTLLAVNSVVPSGVLTVYKTHLVKHALNLVAANPDDKAFFAGWVTRINS